MSDIETTAPAAASPGEFSKETFDTLTSMQATLTNSTGAFAIGGSIAADVLKVNDVQLFYQGLSGFGVVKLPFSPETAAALTAVAHPSSHGVGDQTVYDPSYRQAKEITVPNFALSPDPAVQATLLGAIKSTLVHGQELRAELYKLNVYGEGGFFKPHRDTPRGESHIGTLLLSLPSDYTGGELVVRHNGHAETFDWSSHAKTPVFQWAFLYSDCEHEVLTVTSGHRVTIQYNVFTASPYPSLEDIVDTRLTWLEGTLKSLAAGTDRPLTLAFALQHEYPFARPRSYHRANAGLEDRLKGEDKVLLKVLEMVGFSWRFKAIYQRDEYDIQATHNSAVRRSENYRAAKVCIDMDMDRDMPPPLPRGDPQFSEREDARREIRRRADALQQAVFNAEMSKLKAREAEKWGKPFQKQLYTSDVFGLLAGENLGDEYSAWRYLTTECGVTCDTKTLWIVTPSSYPQAMTYLTYGNEAQSEIMYSAVAIFVTVNPTVKPETAPPVVEEPRAHQDQLEEEVFMEA